MMQLKSKLTKNTPKALEKDKISFGFSLDYEANVSPKSKRVKVSLKLSFYLIFTYVLLTAFLSQNNLLLPLGEAFLFLFGE
jgi:hypothetical protein